MEYRNLRRTGLKVSELCLGTMQFGRSTDEENALAVMDAFLEAGGNFIDTADIYTNWVTGNPGGVAETIIGKWMKERGNRHQIILATKVRGRMWEGPNGEGLSRAHIMKAIDDSLGRLDTDYIDLYQTHWFDPHTPIEETFRALDDLVHQGKVRTWAAPTTPPGGSAMPFGPAIDWAWPVATLSNPTTTWSTEPNSNGNFCPSVKTRGWGSSPIAPWQEGS